MQAGNWSLPSSQAYVKLYVQTAITLLQDRMGKRSNHCFSSHSTLSGLLLGWSGWYRYTGHPVTGVPQQVQLTYGLLHLCRLSPSLIKQDRCSWSQGRGAMHKACLQRQAMCSTVLPFLLLCYRQSGAAAGRQLESEPGVWVCGLTAPSLDHVTRQALLT